MQTGIIVALRTIAARARDLGQSVARASRPWFTPRFMGPDGLPLHILSAHRLAFSPAEEGWRIAAVETDPQLMLGGLPHPLALLGPAVIEMEVRLDDGSALVAPEVYVDRGFGFNEQDRAGFRQIAEGRWAAYIQNFRGAAALRLDPSVGPADFALRAVTLRKALASDLVLQSVAVTPRPQLPGVVLSGVCIDAMSGVESIDPQGGVSLVDDDPQIVFDLSPMAETGAAAARFTVKLAGGPRLTGPRAFVAYGGGVFESELSFHLQMQPDGSHQVAVAMPALGARVRWDPSEQRGEVRLLSVSAEPVSLAQATEAATPDQPAGADYVQMRAADASNTDDLDAWRKIALALTLDLNKEGLNRNAAISHDYTRWVSAFDEVAADEHHAIRDMIQRMGFRPKFSFIMPTYNTPPVLLEACISALLGQVYPDFEICIADDRSTDPKVIALLEGFAAADSRVKVTFRPQNGHISAASNSALSLATGDFVVLMDHDDLIPAHCLAVIAEYINRNLGAEILYSDEDKLSASGVRIDPYFKGSFNEYLMFGHNMVSHVGVYSRDLVTAVGGFREGYEGSQDYDLLLRCLDRCGAAKIVHIPHVLYHWRMLPGSTAVSADQKSYAIDAAQKALNDHFDRKGLPYRSIQGVAPGLSGLGIRPSPTRAKVSIIIPTRDRLDLLAPCMDSILAIEDDAVEIIIVDNGSEEEGARDYLEGLARTGVARVCASPGAFNFSSLCNAGVAAASGEIICLLNNDTEVLASDWLARARAHLSVPDVGVVGARLFYPDRTLQHFGLYLGMAAHRVAGSPHRGMAEASYGYFGKARLIQEFSAVTAACLFVRKADYLSVGGFDEALAVAYNDVDFCLKIRASGRRVICDPDITLIHKESKSRGADTDLEKERRLEVEAGLMRDRWAAQLDNDPYYNPNLTLDDDDLSLAPHPRTPLPWREI